MKISTSHIPTYSTGQYSTVRYSTVHYITYIICMPFTSTFLDLFWFVISRSSACFLHVSSCQMFGFHTCHLIFHGTLTQSKGELRHLTANPSESSPSLLPNSGRQGNLTVKVEPSFSFDLSFSCAVHWSGNKILWVSLWQFEKSKKMTWNNRDSRVYLIVRFNAIGSW